MIFGIPHTPIKANYGEPVKTPENYKEPFFVKKNVTAFFLGMILGHWLTALFQYLFTELP